MCNDNFQIFNSVCHMLALTEVHKTLDNTCDLVLVVLATDDNSLEYDFEKLIQKINQDYGFRLIPEQLKQAISILLLKNLVTLVDGKLIIDAIKKTEVIQKIDDAQNIEKKAMDDWFLELSTKYGLEEDWKVKLWMFLRCYTGNLLRRYGFRTQQLLFSGTHIEIADAEKTIDEIFMKSYNDYASDIPYDYVVSALTCFFKDISDNQLQYMSELFDGAMTYFALVSDDELQEYLTTSISPIKVICDTNFIFGVVELHSYPLNEISKEILRLVSKNKIPLTFIIHPKTLEEYDFAIERYGKKLKEGEPWQPGVSLAALYNGHFSSIERKYHELNSSSQLTVEEFLERYRNSRQLLHNYGFEIFEPQSMTAEEETEQNKLIENYKIHIETRYEQKREKSQISLCHDITILQLARKNRIKGSSRIIDAESMCLTIDSTLYSFDWYDGESENTEGVTIFPNQLLNILIPFTSMTCDFKKHFIETFALPNFRVIGNDYSEVKRKALIYLNTFSNLSTEVAIRILTDSFLLQRLQEVPINSNDQFEDIIEKAIAKDNVLLQAENKRIMDLYDNLKSEYDDLIRTKEKNKRNFRKVSIGSLVFLVLIFCIFFLPNIVTWTWFIGLQNIIGLKFTLTLIALCIAWIIADENKKRRNWVCSVILIPIIIGIAKLFV